jgi:tripartite-type tricarboxylate transporter receptor subunit TctC
VPFAPGGSSSIVARSLAAEMEKGLGQPIIVENKPGGGGNVAMHEVARSDPDGYTLIIGHIGSLAVNPYMYSKLPYDVDKDFAAVSLLATVPRSTSSTPTYRRKTCANSSRSRRRSPASCITAAPATAPPGTWRWNI